MKYLCARHIDLLQNDEALALRLWHSAMQHGRSAQAENRWRMAQSFFGAAFEIAVIRLNDRQTTGFAAMHLCDAARLLASCLCCLDEFDEAQDSLRFVHHFLLEEVNKPAASYDQKRALIRLLLEFLKRATTLMRLRGQSTMADSLTMISNKVTASVRQQYLH